MALQQVGELRVHAVLLQDPAQQIGGLDVPDAGGYRLFLLHGHTVAGIGPLTEGPPSWTTYVNVDDVDGVVAEVARLGGTVVVPPMDLPNGSGRIAWGREAARQAASARWAVVLARAEARQSPSEESPVGFTVPEGGGAEIGRAHV